MENDEAAGDAGTARLRDTPGTGMFAPEGLDPAVERLAALARR